MRDWLHRVCLFLASVALGPVWKPVWTGDARNAPPRVKVAVEALPRRRDKSAETRWTTPIGVFFSARKKYPALFAYRQKSLTH